MGLSQRAGVSTSVADNDHTDYNTDTCEKKTISGWSCELLTFPQLPHWLKDNEYIRASFRPELNSYKECFKSIFRLHTETCNIWSHLIGAVLFLGLLLRHVLYDDAPLLQKVTFTVFYLGAITCLGMSASFHTLSCHSPDIAKRWAKFDYAGIILLTVTSFCPWLYYSYYCHTLLRDLYMCMAAFCGTFSLFITLTAEFEKPHYRPLRAGLFIVLGLTGVIPALHYFILGGIVETWLQVGHCMIFLFLMAAFYISGGLIYANRIPERFCPGLFDIWGQSHQILHICVIIAALSCYHGAITLSNERHAGLHPC